MFIEVACLFDGELGNKLINTFHIEGVDTLLNISQRRSGGKCRIRMNSGNIAITTVKFKELKLLIQGAKPETVQVLYGDKDV